MKKVFLLLTSALMGVASFAGPWEYADNTLTIPYNSYGTKDADGSSVQYQGGVSSILDEAVFDATEETGWTPAKGEVFMVTVSGTPDYTGKFQLALIDEQEAVDYWGAWSEMVTVDVTEGVPFEYTAVLSIANTTQTDASKPSFGEDLTVADLVIAAEMVGVTYAESDQAPVRTISNCKFEVNYQPAMDVEGLFLTYQGPADNAEDGYKFQSSTNSAVSAAKAGQYVNVSFTGKALNEVSQVMFTLIDGSEAAGWYKPLCEMTTFKANIAEGSNVSVNFSMALTDDPSEAPAFKEIFLAQSPKSGVYVIFQDAKVVVDVTDAPKYGEPTVAVEEVSNVTIENGVVYSAGQIVVYNVAGQVVATASQELSIDSLQAGVYFIATAEGTVKISK